MLVFHYNPSFLDLSSDDGSNPEVPATCLHCHRCCCEGNCQKTWPDIFPVPTFFYEAAHVFEEGNCAFDRPGKTLTLNMPQKHNILENMAAVMYNFKPYPSDRDVGMAAEALITAHPCLKEPGSVSGWYGWKISLKFMMGNYRTKCGGVCQCRQKEQK